MGQFRPVDRLELVERDGRTTLVTFRPRRRHRPDSVDYPGFLPPPRRLNPNGFCPARETGGHIRMTVPLMGGETLRVCRICWTPI
jgi:hypothetical protein